MAILFDPYEEIRRFRKKMDELFDELFRKEVNFRTATTLRMPEVEMEEKGKEYVIKIDMPGLDKRDIEVNIVGNVLEVKGEKKAEKKEKKKGFYYSEKSYSGFYRTLLLPDDVDVKKVSAEYKNGVLIIHLGKTGKKKEEKKIKVKVK